MAEESATLARDVVYPQLAATSEFDAATLAADATVARQQLARAGYALAGLLNRVFQ